MYAFTHMLSARIASFAKVEFLQALPRRFRRLQRCRMLPARRAVYGEKWKGKSVLVNFTPSR